MYGVSFSLSVTIILTVRSVISGGRISTDGEGVCWTNQCRVVSDILKSNMNRAVRPCNDFYEYVCGNFIKNAVIPNGHASFVYMESVQYTVREKVIEYLSKPFNETESNIVRWAKYQYQACMDERRLDYLGIKPLFDQMKQCTGCSIFGRCSIGWHKRWHEIHDFYNRLMGKGALFNIGVKESTLSGESVLTIDVTKDHFAHRPGRIEPNDIEKHKKFLVSIAKEVHNFGCKTSFGTAGVEAIEKVILFREFLTKVTNVAESDKHGPISRFTTISELQELTDKTLRKKSIDWLLVMNSTFRKVKYVDFTESTTIYFKNMPYFLATLGVIDRTPEQVIIDHIHFYFVENYIGYTNTKMYQLYQEMHMNVLPSRSVACVSDRAFIPAFNFIYAQHFLPQKTVSMAKRVVEQVLVTLKDQIRRTGWMSKITKRMAMGNVDMIYRGLAYEDWDENVNERLKFYSQLAVSHEYLQNVLRFDSFSYYKELSMLLKRPAQKIGGSSRSVSVNQPYYAAYSNNKKTELPMLVHELPLYGVDLPEAVKYAGLGAIYGEELANLFDSTSVEKSEPEIHRWDNISMKQYLARLELYANRMRNVVPKEFVVAGLEFEINPDLYVADAIIEYSGLVAAYQAYRKKFSEVGGWEKLIYLEDIAGDKLFFVAYTMGRCEAINAEKFRAMMKVSSETVHLPYQLSVNLALANMKAFSDTFKCRRNDSMNAAKKIVFFDEAELHKG